MSLSQWIAVAAGSVYLRTRMALSRNSFVLFPEHLPHPASCGMKSGLDRRFCWEAAPAATAVGLKESILRRKSMNLGFTIMNLSSRWRKTLSQV